MRLAHLPLLLVLGLLASCHTITTGADGTVTEVRPDHPTITTITGAAARILADK